MTISSATRKSIKLLSAGAREMAKRAGDTRSSFQRKQPINLADDDELLEADAGSEFFHDFCWNRNPDTDTLIAMSKETEHAAQPFCQREQNLQGGNGCDRWFYCRFRQREAKRGGRDGRMHRITAIPSCMLGLLSALPTTQLTRRLAREGRLHAGHDNLGEAAADSGVVGLNFETRRPRRDVYVDYATILERIYSRDAYFNRVRRLGRLIDRSKRPMRLSLRELSMVARLTWHILINQRDLRGSFWSTVVDCAIHNPRAMKYIMITMALYLHFGPFSRYLRAHIEDQIALIDGGQRVAPRLAVSSG